MPSTSSHIQNITPQNIDVIILAAGKGTRMPSAKPKALQTLLGDAMISHVYNAIMNIEKQAHYDLNSETYLQNTHATARSLLQNIWTVVGHEAEAIKNHLLKEHGKQALEHAVLQEEQLGTGHAVLCVLKEIQEKNRAYSLHNKENIQHAHPNKILVLNADTPLMNTQVLQNFIEQSQDIPLSFMSLQLDEPASYGRVLRTHFPSQWESLSKSHTFKNQSYLEQQQLLKNANSGTVARIVEAKDFKKEFHQEETGAEIYEVNAGIYFFDYSLLEELLPQISTENQSGEYYLTDIVSLAHEKGYTVEAFSAPSKENQNTETGVNTCPKTYPKIAPASINKTAPIPLDDTSTALLGVNTPYELAHAEKLMQKKEIDRRLQEGIIIHTPEMVRISPFAIIEKGVEIFGPCEIYGKSFIGQNTRIESHCYIENTHISKNCLVRSFCHFQDATIDTQTSIGPYARLRPGAQLAENVHIGNFVEIKKSTVQKGSKINHLSYIGDSEVGAGVNVGAGCITCNYDGVNKHKTIIEDNAFLGSNCAFVAPVTIGKNSLVGAGSVITKDVPDNTLAVARAYQHTVKKSNLE